MNVITKSGGNRFQYDAAYYWQTDALTSQPVRLEYDRARQLDSGYERAAYRDFTTSLGGPVVRDRLWFFSGYQHLRDSDSQPGTDPGSSEGIRAGQDLREGHLAPGSGLAADAELSRRVLVQPRNAVGDEAARCDATPRRVGAGDQFRSSHSYGLTQYGLGRPRGAVPLHAGHVADLGRSDDPPSHRPARKHLERRPPANRPGAASAHDGQGHRQPLSSGVVRRGSRMEDGRASRSGRASRGCRPSDWRELCLQKRRVEAAYAAGARQLGRPVRHRRRVRERRRPAGRPGHDQSGAALRSQPRHQSGRAGVRRARARDRTDDRRPGHGGLLEHRVAARGRCHQARYRRPNDAASECREIRPGPVDR